MLDDILGYSVEHIHTDGIHYEWHEHVWPLAFDEKRYEVIFIQLTLWDVTLHLKKVMFETQIDLPIYEDKFWIHNVFQISKTPIFWERRLTFKPRGHRNTSI